jgi:hypothetical protein
MLITVPSELTILGMEVTQATQFSRSNLHLPTGTFQADNSVPLIENKRTLVRVYVDSGLDGFDLGRGTGVVPGITAQLHGTRGGAPLPGSPLEALNQPIEVARNALYLTVRQQWQSTLNFELPASWLTGTVTLRAVVDPAFALKRRHSGTVATQTSISFVSARPLKLVGVMIRYTGWQIDAASNRVRVDIGAPAFATLVNAANWLRRTYPTNDIQFFTAPGNETLTFDGDLTDGSGGGCGDEWGGLMDELDDLADDYSADDDAVWIGMLPTGWGGNAWGGCGGGADGAIGVAVIFANDTGPTLAQEVGHGYGRNHAPGCGAGSPDGSYPAYGKASSASIGDFGADWPTPGSTAWQIQDPATQNDFMGYCGSDWVSPYTYMGLFNGGISSSSSLPAGDHDHGAGATVPGDPERDTLVLHGRIWRTDQVELKPAFHFRRTTRAPIGSATGYRVELRDEQGRAVEDRPILVRESTQAEGHAVITFSVALPFTPKAREVVILRSEEVLLKQRISAQPPRLSALTVNPEGNKLTVQWAAQAESDKLWHKLRFSADAGRTWLGVARRLERPSCELDLGRLPGGEECIVEVYTSDGVATGRLRSAPFRVAHKLPRAVIAAPVRGESLTSSWVRLLGAGIDEGGRAISKEHLVWSSNRDGTLGRGDFLEVRLSPGRHTLRLVVRDAGEREGAAEVAVKVE